MEGFTVYWVLEILYDRPLINQRIINMALSCVTATSLGERRLWHRLHGVRKRDWGEWNEQNVTNNLILQIIRKHITNYFKRNDFKVGGGDDSEVGRNGLGAKWPVSLSNMDTLLCAFGVRIKEVRLYSCIIADISWDIWKNSIWPSCSKEWPQQWLIIKCLTPNPKMQSTRGSCWFCPMASSLPPSSPPHRLN